MTDQDDIARAAARSLSSRYGTQLPIELEKQIAGPGGGTDQYFDPSLAVSIAGFVLAVAQFVYQIYKDQKEAGDAGDVKRKVQAEVKAPAQLSAQQRSDVVDAVLTAAAP